MTVLNIIHILVSIVLVAVILLQVKGQGTGLFGSADNSFRTRRGLELQVFRFTIGLVVVFIILSIISASGWAADLLGIESNTAAPF